MKTWFERAIFLSWYCGRGDCKFCYMSTQKDKIKDPRLARRRISSILAEVIICKNLGWKIEFLSGGYESFTSDELLDLFKKIFEITKEKQWLNIGVIKEEDIIKFLPYIKGLCGAVECVNEKVHKYVCPSKPIKEITDMYELCDKHNLEKAMTIILGLGETEDDIPKLIKFIQENKIKNVTFYRLNPQKETEFKEGPTTEYYVKWLKEIRKEFPNLNIIAGSWVNHVDEIHELLNAGANNFTKFPSIKLFNSKFAQTIEKECKTANREFQGSLTKLPNINWDNEIKKLSFDDKLKENIKVKLNSYLKKMGRSL